MRLLQGGAGPTLTWQTKRHYANPMHLVLRLTLTLTGIAALNIHIHVPKANCGTVVLAPLIESEEPISICSVNLHGGQSGGGNTLTLSPGVPAVAQ